MVGLGFGFGDEEGLRCVKRLRVSLNDENWMD